ncbi:DUF1415 domain-containing protein [Kiloniella laminariae]|uniref:DUF1415 domain-containing protein n=1 Tax=Kiloniella laminariae TaxID=454162 RepID=A0ABT4LP29_9PROT|nr:DUF1415 domain-containing protein [Kiloniella laminariae]MCZ4282893.1 DUF1415 domain-containing protein [Kiloniella laminariae]
MTQAYPEYKAENAGELTRLWVEQMVIGLNLCPFAAPEVRTERLHYVVVKADTEEQGYLGFLEELSNIAEAGEEEYSTSLMVFSQSLADFDDFLDFLSLAEEAIEQSGLSDVFQLASFHPRYCFEGVGQEDLSNWTNRSPFPMLHLIREGQMSRALASYSKPEEIPQRNMQLLRELGREGLVKRFPPLASYWPAEV